MASMRFLNKFISGYGIVGFFVLAIPQCEGFFSSPELRKKPADKLSPHTITVSYMEGAGVGYPSGYTSLKFFAARDRPWLQQRLQPFFDARGHILNTGKGAVNIGAGGRYLIPSHGIAFGLNTYYDYRDDWRSYSQIGVGVEALTCSIDVRINGYIPIGERSKTKEKEFTFPGGYFAICNRKQRSLGGVDGEISSSMKQWLPCTHWNLGFAAGPYFYHRECGDSIMGIKGRLSLQIYKYLSIEGRASYDNVFRDRFQGLISLTFPLGKQTAYSKSCKDSCSKGHLREIAVQPVQRSEIIVLDHKRCSWEWNW